MNIASITRSIYESETFIESTCFNNDPITVEKQCEGIGWRYGHSYMVPLATQRSWGGREETLNAAHNH